MRNAKNTTTAAIADSDLKLMLDASVALVREVAQREIIPRFLRVSHGQRKDDGSLCSEADLAAQHFLLDRLTEIHHCPIIGEEMTAAVQQARWHDSSDDDRGLWCIDPIDGTTNFIHGFPQYAVSIALAHRGQVTQAVVYDTVRNEMFTASKGGGAFLNERRIRVSKCIRLEDALIGTGFPYRIYDHIDAYLAIFKELARKSAGIRRPGAAALDLAYVACGRFDGFWEFGLSPWDIAGGALLISEAGGLVSDLAGNERYLQTGNLVAGTPKVFAQLLQLIDGHRTPGLAA